MLLPAADPNPLVPCLMKLALHPALARQKSVKGQKWLKVTSGAAFQISTIHITH